MLCQTGEIMTYRECQKYLKVGKNTLLDLIHNGSIDAFKIGNRWKIPEESVYDYIKTDCEETLITNNFSQSFILCFNVFHFIL